MGVGVGGGGGETLPSLDYSRRHFVRGRLGRDTVDRIQCPPRGSCKVLSGTSIRILAASRYIFAVQRASYSICSTPKAPEQSPCSHVLTYMYTPYVPCLNSLVSVSIFSLSIRVYVFLRTCGCRTYVEKRRRRMLVSM